MPQTRYMRLTDKGIIVLCVVVIALILTGAALIAPDTLSY